MEVNIVERPRSAPSRVSLRIGELCNIQRVKAVNIFLLANVVEHGMFVDMRWQWKLHQDSVHSRVYDI